MRYSILDNPVHVGHNERTVVAAMLLSDAAYRRGLVILRATDFTDELLQRLFRLIAAAESRELELRFVEVSKGLSRDERSKLGAMLVDFSYVGSTRYFFENSMRQVLFASRNRVAAAIYEETLKDPQVGEDLLGEVEQRLRQASETMRIAADDDCLQSQSFKAIDATECDDGVTLVATGLEEFDRLFGGVVRGELTTIAAKTGGGKSAFALNIAQHAAKRNRAVAYFSCEIDATQLLWRIYANQCEIPLDAFYRRRLEQKYRRELLAKQESVTQWRVRIFDDSKMSINELRDKAFAAKTEFGTLDLIVVDYLQLLQLPNPRQGLRENISQLTRDLKVLAGELKVALLCISQLSREGVKDGITPNLTHLKESGSIENDSAMVVFLYHDEKQPSRDGVPMVCHVQKCRHAAPAKVRTVFVGRFQRFEEPDGLDNQFNNALGELP